MFSVFKQYYMYFYIFFYLHVFLKNTKNIIRITLPNSIFRAISKCLFENCLSSFLLPKVYLNFFCFLFLRNSKK